MASKVEMTSQRPCHALTVKQISEAFPETNLVPDNLPQSRGLSSQRAQQLLAENGPNELSKSDTQSEWILFLKQFTDPFMVLLWLAGFLSLISFFVDTSVMINLWLSLVLFGVVLLTCIMSYWQERQANKVIEGFKNLLPQSTTVIRDAEHHDISAAALVVGDLVSIKAGDKAPADLRVLSCSELKIDMSSLTGESEPIALHPRPELTAQEDIEARNIAFSGSLIVQGTGLGLVVRTGDNTAIGKIASLTTHTRVSPSQMEVDVQRFVRLIAALAVGMGALVFIIGCIKQRGHDILPLFINGFLVIIVANVPQGLPATVTSLLTITARRLSTKNVFVKRLKIIENLGCTTTICTDKTGTLTKNELTLTTVWTAQKSITGNFGAFFRVTRTPSREAAAPGVKAVHRIACICNGARAQFIDDNTGEDNARFTGNPADVALLTWAHPLFSAREVREQYIVVHDEPFDSSIKMQITVVRDRDMVPTDEGQRYSVFVKGAPEILFQRCSTILMRSGPVPIDDAVRENFEAIVLELAGQGKRLIGFCEHEFVAPANAAFVHTSQQDKPAEANAFHVPSSGLCFVGLVALMDPPRENVADAVEKCHTAGIKVFMVTGDHPITAQAIAREVGILPSLLGNRRPSRTTLVRGSHVVSADVSGPSRTRVFPENVDPSTAIDSEVVILGKQLQFLSDKDWDQLLAKPALVFARTSPQQKLLIVQHCQRNGQIVAMTGDGVNDAPALKQSDVGVAMGIAGSQVAKEAADVILMDDSFASIVYAVEQGRLIFDNLIKTIAYTLAHLWPEVFQVLLTLVFGLPAGLSSLQILSIDLGTELVPAISLAYEKAEMNILTRPPRNTKRDKLVSWPLLIYSYAFSGMVITAACLIAYTLVFWDEGLSLSDIAFSSDKYWLSDTTDDFCVRGKCFSPDQQLLISNRARSAWYIALVMGQAGHIWSCKTRFVSVFKHQCWDNAITNIGVLFAASLAVVFCYVPGVQELMQTDSVNGAPWICAAGAGLVLFVYNEIRKNVPHCPRILKF